MTITRHPFRVEVDLPRVDDLIKRMPFSSRHVIDFPWRLSSPAIAEGRDAVFWEDAEGQMVGFAAWLYYWAALDFFILPGVDEPHVKTDLFAWAAGRFRALDEERGFPLPYWIEFRDDDHARQQLVAAHGFLQTEERYVLLQHTLVNLSPVPSLPAGFKLRPLVGEQEAAAYSKLHQEAFASTSMTPEWRMRTLRHPRYRSELDLVVTAPDGSLAGFCVGWYDHGRRSAQIEPIGVHPRFQRHGLGRILLLEILQRFKASGAERAIIETNVDRTPARCAYEGVGFQQIHIIRAQGKRFS